LALSEVMLDKIHAKILEQKARNETLKNDVLQVETYWKKKEISHNERIKKYQKQMDVAVSRYQMAAFRLDMKRKWHELTKEEEKMRAEGILSPKKEPHIVIMGKKYKNYDQFQKSTEYAEFKEGVAQRVAFREAEELEKMAKYREAVYNSAMRNRYLRKIHFKNKVIQLSQNIQQRVENDPIKRIERGEEVSFQDWPDHWKKNWRKFAEEKYGKVKQ